MWTDELYETDNGAAEYTVWLSQTGVSLSGDRQPRWRITEETYVNVDGAFLPLNWAIICGGTRGP